jgi:hypothetical protein
MCLGICHGNVDAPRVDAYKGQVSARPPTGHANAIMLAGWQEMPECLSHNRLSRTTRGSLAGKTCRDCTKLNLSFF